MRKDSILVHLDQLKVGEKWYTEVSPLRVRYGEKAPRKLPAASRRKELGKKQFTETFLTAVGLRPGDVRYLLCIERIN